MADLINNMGLEEEVLQQASTNGKLDAPNVSMTQVRKVRPELVTKDPSLLKYFKGVDVNELSEDDYMGGMLNALSKEYADDEAMAGMTGGQRIEKLARKHPKQLDGFFSEYNRRLNTNSDALLQDGVGMVLGRNKEVGSEEDLQKAQDLVNYGSQNIR